MSNYKVITYVSIPLKKNTVILDAADDDSVATFDEEKPSKKKKRKKEDEQTYIIDGVEVREEDLTFDERADMEANMILNNDGFYTPLLPLDYYEETENVKQKNGNGLKIALVIFFTVAILAGLAFVMIKVL